MSKPPVHVGQIVQVTIDRLTFGGAGLARYQGFVLFIPFTVPGDLVEARISQVRKGFAEVVITKIVAPSSDRIPAPCPIFTKCGGCDWQNLSYRKQLEYKEQIVREALAKTKLEVEEFKPILPSPQEYRYRNRIQVQQVDGKIGFRAPKSHTIVDVKDCLLAENPLIEALHAIRQKNSSHSKRWDIRKLKDGAVKTSAVGEEELELGFSQVNTQQNALLIEKLVELVKNKNYDTVLDLYAGSGNLTFPLYNTLHPKLCIAVESNLRAVEEGQSSAATSKANIQFIPSSVDQFIEKHEKTASTLVVLDPPRAGAGEAVMKKLSQLQPEALLYVSCDPMTYTRDVRAFLQSSSRPYKLEYLQPLDMFPQTYHIEIISMIVPT